MSKADIVCLEYEGLASLLPSTRRNHWALTLPCLNSEMARQAANVAGSRRSRLLYRWDGFRARRYERWIANSYDSLFVVSDEDAALLDTEAIVVPNGVDLERYGLTPRPPDCRILFTGALYTKPNVDGIAWFCAEVWPRVRARLPEARLDIVGLQPLPEVLVLGELPGVELHIDVPDVSVHLARSGASIVPLRIGTGSRLKALEAFAAGRPVVGTSIGMGGLEVEHGKHALIADSPQVFAEATIAVLTKDDLARTLSAHARTLVEDRYSWPEIGRRYVDALLGRAGFLERR